MSHIALIQNAAEKVVGKPVVFCNYTPVTEKYSGQVAWEGAVSEFVTLDRVHVYAWEAKGADGQREYVAIIGPKPVDSAAAAVRAWLHGRRR